MDGRGHISLVIARGYRGADARIERAHRAYDQAFMDVARSGLTVTPGYLEANEYTITQIDGATAGWFSRRPVGAGL